MARKYASGIYSPTNTSKYIGKHQPKYRSSWEKQFMMFCDQNQHIKYWASESHKIPYINPITGKKTIYIPDFLIIYNDKHGNQKTEIVEIKPSSHILGKATSAYDKTMAVINESKWKSAKDFCDQIGIGFRVITEQNIFYRPRKNK